MDDVKNEQNQSPPKWANNFLEWYCDSSLLEEIQGDLHEAFYLRTTKKGLRKAKFLFIKEVLLFFRPSSFKKSIFTPLLQPMPGLFQNYLKISRRNLLKNKVFSFINIFGLSVGLAACFLIMQYVSFELSYDQFFKESDSIYRVYMDDMATNHPGTGPAMKADFPEVEDFARMVPQSIFAGNFSALSYKDSAGNLKVFNEEKIYDVDPSFLTIFSFPFLHGHPETALPNANSVVISESVSRKFFGQQNPLGKTLTINGFRHLTVTGVIKDIPENSHHNFNVLVSYFLRGFGEGDWNPEWDWRWPEFYTYVKLKPNASKERLQAKLIGFTDNYLGEIMKELNKEFRFYLQPISDIHLKSHHLKKEPEVRGNEQTIYFLTLIALLILIIAWINYINLSTSKSVERAQEVGMRKVIGASRKQLILQFLAEAFLLNIIAIILACLIVIAALPYFNQLTGKTIGSNITQLALLKTPDFWLYLMGVFVLGSLFSGLYPAILLSSFQEITVLKGKFYRSKSGVYLRKFLVGFQFVISVALIAGTIMVYRQVNFMRSQDLGYQKDQLLIVKAPRVGDSTFMERYETFNYALKSHPQIMSFAPTSEIPGKPISQLNEIRNIDEESDANSHVFQFYTNKNFIETYGLELLAGRNFTRNDNLYPLDNRSEPIPIMVNEKTIAQLGFRQPDEAVNQLVYFRLGPSDRKGEIIGVLNNYHQRSLKNGYDAMIFFPVSNFVGEYFSINLHTQNLGKTISFLENQFKEKFPGNEFDYFFLDDFFDGQYNTDQQFGKVFGFFSSLAIIIAGLGLFGLSTFMIAQRTKEIAVRKVLGARILGMIYLFLKDFLSLILIANIITIPVVFFVIQRWLNEFAFHVNIGWMIFVFPSVILLTITIATVSFQTLKTCAINPVESLRSD